MVSMRQWESFVADVEAMRASPRTGCAVWRHSKTTGGYGRVWDGGKQRGTHLAALEMTIPRPIGKVCTSKGGWVPGHKLHAAHGPCHKKLCYNTRHLSWKTPAENNADKERDGTGQFGERHPFCTIPQSEVDAIIAEYKGPQKPGPRTGTNTGPSQRELARKYGLSQPHVSAILRGEVRSR